MCIRDRITRDGFRAAQVAAGAEFEEGLQSFAPKLWGQALGSSGTAGAVSQLLQASGGTDGRITPAGLRWGMAGGPDAGPGDRIDLANPPELEACLSLPLCGEPRAAFCYLRPRRVQDFQDYCQRILDGHALLKPSQELIHQGLFGQGEPHPGLQDRVGDYTLLLTGRSVIRDQLPSEKGTIQIGVHGGLSELELFVPLCRLR